MPKKGRLMYKLVRLTGTGYKTLYKSYQGGVRWLPIDQWLKAERRWAGEGGRKYWTGFHVVDSYTHCLNYLNRFKNKSDIVCVPVLARGSRRKPNGSRGVYLASEIKLCL